MKTALVAAAACLGLSATASAGPYAGIALGTEPAVNDEFVAFIAYPDGRSLRALGGYRWGSFSAEGSLGGFGIRSRVGVGSHAYQLAAALKGSLPLGNDFEAFGRLGLERTWLTVGGYDLDMSGNGFLVAAGFEYRLDAVLAKASVFVDYTIRHVTLNNEHDLTSRMFSLGFMYGF
jgi:hypothetical protein